MVRRSGRNAQRSSSDPSSSPPSRPPSGPDSSPADGNQARQRYLNAPLASPRLNVPPRQPAAGLDGLDDLLDYEHYQDLERQQALVYASGPGGPVRDSDFDELPEFDDDGGTRDQQGLASAIGKGGGTSLFKLATTAPAKGSGDSDSDDQTVILDYSTIPKQDGNGSSGALFAPVVPSNIRQQSAPLLQPLVNSGQFSPVVQRNVRQQSAPILSPASGVQASGGNGSGGNGSGGNGSGGNGSGGNGPGGSGPGGSGPGGSGPGGSGSPASSSGALPDDIYEADASKSVTSDQGPPSGTPSYGERLLARADLRPVGIRKLKRSGLIAIYNANDFPLPNPPQLKQNEKPDSIRHLADDLRTRQNTLITSQKMKDWAARVCREAGLITDGDYPVLAKRLKDRPRHSLHGHTTAMLRSRDLAPANNECDRLMKLLRYEWDVNRIRCDWDKEWIFERRDDIAKALAGRRTGRLPPRLPGPLPVRGPTVHLFPSRNAGLRYAKTVGWHPVSGFEGMGNSLFRLVDVTGDGNCGLRAFARAYYGNEQFHLRVREELKTYWSAVDVGMADLNNPLNVARGDLYRQIMRVRAEDMDDDGDPDGTIEEQIFRLRCWMTHDLFQILADCYGVTMVLWQYFAPPANPAFQVLVIRGSASQAATQTQIHIVFQNPNHWQALLPIQPFGGRGTSQPVRYRDHEALFSGPPNAIPQVQRYFPLINARAASGTNNETLPGDLDWLPEVTDEKNRRPRYRQL